MDWPAFQSLQDSIACKLHWTAPHPLEHGGFGFQVFGHSAHRGKAYPCRATATTALAHTPVLVISAPFGLYRRRLPIPKSQFLPPCLVLGVSGRLSTPGPPHTQALTHNLSSVSLSLASRPLVHQLLGAPTPYAGGLLALLSLLLVRILPLDTRPDDHERRPRARPPIWRDCCQRPRSETTCMRTRLFPLHLHLHLHLALFQARPTVTALLQPAISTYSSIRTSNAPPHSVQASSILLLLPQAYPAGKTATAPLSCDPNRPRDPQPGLPLSPRPNYNFPPPARLERACFDNSSRTEPTTLMPTCPTFTNFHN